MEEDGVRIEGIVPKNVKDWIELEAMKSNTPIRTIVGLACSYYKAQNDRTMFGSIAASEMLSRIELDAIIKNCTLIEQVSKYKMPDCVSKCLSIANILKNISKNTNKKSIDEIKKLRRSLISDTVNSLRHIQDVSPGLYFECITILGKAIHKHDVAFFNQIIKQGSNEYTDMNNSYNSKQTDHSKLNDCLKLNGCSNLNDLYNTKEISYVGNTGSDFGMIGFVEDLAHNCITVQPKQKDSKIQACISEICKRAEPDQLEMLLSIFYETLKKDEVI